MICYQLICAGSMSALQALCTCLNWVSNLVVGLSFPAMLHALNIAGSYAVYAVSYSCWGSTSGTFAAGREGFA